MFFRTVHLCSLVAVMVFGIPQPGWAQKTTAVDSVEFVASMPATATVATATIEKGKPKRFLVANATAVSVDSISPGDTCTIYFYLAANGVPFDNISIQATHAETTCDCANGGAFCIGCMASATATLDLDAAEAANPGMFKKQPIDVDLILGSNDACLGSNGNASVVVQMVKK